MHTHFEKLKVTKLPDSMAEITGEITVAFLAECRPGAVKALSERLKIPGFRPGHIPEETIVKTIGEMGVLEEVAEVAMAREYSHIIEEAKLSPIARPHVAITKLAPHIPLEFKITVALEPEFELPDYKKIAADVAHEVLKEDASNEDKFRATQKRRLEIIGALVKATTVTIPEVLVKAELEKMVAQFKDDVATAGLTWDNYLKHLKKSEDELKAEWREKAVERVKAELVVSKIAHVEKLEPSAEELEREAKHLLEHYPDADPLRARLYIYTMLRNEKTMKFLEELK